MELKSHKEIRSDLLRAVGLGMGGGRGGEELAV